MEPLAFAVIATNRNSSADLARSALPDAPVIAPLEKAGSLARSRRALASGLRRLAEVTAPAAPTDRTPARLTLTVDRRSGVNRWDEPRCKPSPTMSA